MTELRADVLVLGAGIVGVSTALHLQQRGRNVVLIDRHDRAGEETSYGNAGIIERASVTPYMFPRSFTTLLRYALRLAPDVNYHLSHLPTVLPWLIRYFLNSSVEGTRRSTLAALPLIERCLTEHMALIDQAGSSDLLRPSGWITLFRSDRSLASGLASLERDRTFGINGRLLNATDLAEMEPNLIGDFAGAIHLSDPGFAPNPGGLVKAYAGLFLQRGGRFIAADARTLRQNDRSWQVAGPNGALVAKDVVVALGPWSDAIFRPLGYRIPLAVKRGYHLHLHPLGNAKLRHPVLDIDNGYVLAPMVKGIRLTTGAEFAARDAVPTPVQVRRALPVARKLFPLGEQIESQPWMGARPCLPDMLPVIGKAGRHAGLWFNFGHQHHGLTLGPVTGRLLAELMTGEAPFTNPAHYQADRFS